MSTNAKIVDRYLLFLIDVLKQKNRYFVVIAGKMTPLSFALQTLTHKFFLFNCLLMVAATVICHHLLARLLDKFFTLYMAFAFIAYEMR